jgi:hypothetical protein
VNLPIRSPRQLKGVGPVVGLEYMEVCTFEGPHHHLKNFLFVSELLTVYLDIKLGIPLASQHRRIRGFCLFSPARKLGQISSSGRETSAKTESRRQRWIEPASREIMTTSDSRAKVPACRAAPSLRRELMLGCLTTQEGATDAN